MASRAPRHRDRLPDLITPATTRGVYLWAGDATVRLQRVKFPDIRVDVVAHHHAHTLESAASLARCGLNLAFLSMNWGFPPEEEADHWKQFRDAARIYREQGFRVIGYVQASNCLAEGSYAARDWYARTRTGETVPYFLNRRMTCWNHPDWIAEVESRARGVIEGGGDGVFFDNLWMGATPWVLDGAVGGFAGCACARCVTTFSTHTGHVLPVRLEPDDAASRAWLEWRAGVVERRFADWARAVRAVRPDVWILANNCDPMLRPTGALFGLRPERLAGIQDALLVENVAMPRNDVRRRQLVCNALPLKALRAVAPERPILSVTYENGIGLDGLPPVTAIVSAAAEAAALGACPIVKGSEYRDAAGRFTVLTADDLAPTRNALAPLLSWLAGNGALFQGVRPDPDALVLLDPAVFDEDFSRAATATFAVAMALIVEGIPFAFATPRDCVGGALPVLVPPGIDVPQGCSMAVRVPESWIAPIRLPGRNGRGLVRSAANGPLTAIGRLYFGTAGGRRAFDRLGITARFLRSPYFRVPRAAAKIRERLALAPLLHSSGACLVERWARADGASLLHIVNYEERSIDVHLMSGRGIPRLHTPDTLTSRDRERVHIERYAVLEFNASCAGNGATAP